METSEQTGTALEERFEDCSCLVLDDDVPFMARLSQSMSKRGFGVIPLSSLSSALELIRRSPPQFAVVDFRLRDGSGLDAVAELVSRRRDARCIVLTGYGTVQAAVTAVRSGARDVLYKPSFIEDIVHALTKDKAGNDADQLSPPSADQMRWDHIQIVFRQSGYNISETARQLNMHRRTLQRILNKGAPTSQRRLE